MYTSPDDKLKQAAPQSHKNVEFVKEKTRGATLWITNTCLTETRVVYNVLDAICMEIQSKEMTMGLTVPPIRDTWDIKWHWHLNAKTPSRLPATIVRREAGIGCNMFS